MATSSNAFHFPPQASKFIHYNGPLRPKSSTRWCSYKGASSSIPNKWLNINKILETILESKAILEDRGAPTPIIRIAKLCGLLYTGMHLH